MALNPHSVKTDGSKLNLSLTDWLDILVWELQSPFVAFLLFTRSEHIPYRSDSARPADQCGISGMAGSLRPSNGSRRHQSSRPTASHHQSLSSSGTRPRQSISLNDPHSPGPATQRLFSYTKTQKEGRETLFCIPPNSPRLYFPRLKNQPKRLMRSRWPPTKASNLAV